MEGMNACLQWTRSWLCQLMKQSMLGKPGRTWIKPSLLWCSYLALETSFVCVWPSVGFPTYFQHSKLRIFIPFFFFRRSTTISCMMLWMYMSLFFYFFQTGSLAGNSLHCMLLSIPQAWITNDCIENSKPVTLFPLAVNVSPFQTVLDESMMTT